MRCLLTGPAAKYRVDHRDLGSPAGLRPYPAGLRPGDEKLRGNGYFLIPNGIKVGGYVTAGKLIVIASDGDGWDHVSMSCRHRVPYYREVMAVHRLFFMDDEVSMQLQVWQQAHISIHPHTLHLWRPQAASIPLPPRDHV